MYNYLYWHGVAWRIVFYGALGWDPCGVHSICSIYEALGVGRLWHFYSICSIYGALALYVWCVGLVLSCSAYVGASGFGVLGLRLLPATSPFCSSIQLRGPFGLVWGLMAGGRAFASHGGILEAGCTIG